MMVVHKAVAAELVVDQLGEAEADHASAMTIVQNTKCAVACIAAQMSGSVEDALVIVEADVLDRRVRPVGPVVGEGQIDRPDQRKDVDRQQQRRWSAR